MSRKRFKREPMISRGYYVSRGRDGKLKFQPMWLHRLHKRIRLWTARISSDRTTNSL
jgi:hypothetical protein